jgi:hypothetical protein
MRPCRAACLVGLLLLVVHNAHATDPAITAARRHVAGYRFLPGPMPTKQVHADEIAAALTGRDPETSATSFVHAIGRNAKRLLSGDQATRWTGLMNSRLAGLNRLHDERNVLRAFFFATAWRLPLAAPSETNAIRKRLDEWLDVWIDITVQERIAQHHFCRDAWAILTDAQREKLASGEWDQFVRKSTGHERAYFGDRIVRRAIGEPNHPNAFRIASSQLSKAHSAIQKSLLEAERRWRILTFRIPGIPDEWLAEEWRRTSAALKNFFLEQVRQIETLIATGYDSGQAGTRDRISAQVKATQDELAENIAGKLSSGRDLHRQLLSAR